MAKKNPQRKSSTQGKSKAPKRPARKVKRPAIKLKRHRLESGSFLSGVVCECTDQGQNGIDVTITAEIVPPSGGRTNNVQAVRLNAGGGVIGSDIMNNTSGNIWELEIHNELECPDSVKLLIEFIVDAEVTELCSCTNCD